MATNQEHDPVTGRSTTGHEWDGIKELNTPLPKWWVYVFYTCIVWAIGFWILYPSWPTLDAYFGGVLNQNDHVELRQETAAVAQERDRFRSRIAALSVAEVEADPELRTFAMASGRAVFNEACSPCHQVGAGGTEGYPSLVDDKWIWGGTSEAIYQTIKYGVRNENPHSRDPEKTGMQAFGGILTPKEIEQVAEYVAESLSQGKKIADMPGQKIFQENCVVCHGDHGQGDKTLGAPPLNVPVGWTFKRSNETLKQAIVRQVTNPQKGYMPDWSSRLSDPVIKELTVYVHTLGGGQ